METLYNINSLVFWNEKEIRIRKFIEQSFYEDFKNILLKENQAWKFFQIEAPSLIPAELVNPNYTKEDMFFVEKLKDEKQLVLKPETTPSSYVYAQYLLNNNMVLTPFVVWQISKSFRREQDQVIKNMRLKEFYQQEFQCIYTRDTLNDYQEKVLEPLKVMISEITTSPARVVVSDRLPSIV